MSGFIMVPEDMRKAVIRAVEQTIPNANRILAVLNGKPIKLPMHYVYSTGDGDRCRVVAWSKEHAVEQIRRDGRFIGDFIFESSEPAWPDTGVTRVTCPDYFDEDPDHDAPGPNDNW